MSQYPAEIYTPRTMANRPEATYNPDDTKTIYAEDFNKDRDEIVAIQTALGIDPAGDYDTVKAWLSALASAISGIVTDFLSLDDTPASYADQAGKVVSVNATEDGLEFTAPSGGVSSFIGLDDVPASYVDQASKILAVNATEDGLEFTAPSGGAVLNESNVLVLSHNINNSTIGFLRSFFNFSAKTSITFGIYLTAVKDPAPTIELGVYSSDRTTKLASANIAAPVVGYNEVTLEVNLSAKTAYYFGFCHCTYPDAVTRWVRFGQYNISTGEYLYYENTSASSLPADASAWSLARGTICPWFCWY